MEGCDTLAALRRVENRKAFSTKPESQATLFEWSIGLIDLLGLTEPGQLAGNPITLRPGRLLKYDV